HEAVELRDGGERYRGKGVLKAVDNIRSIIAPRLVGLELDDPATLDLAIAELDTSPAFTTLGANAALAVSLASHLAAAAHAGVSLARYLQPEGTLTLPMPMVNIVSGGAHAGRAIDIQDILVIPHAATTFTEAIEWCARVREAGTQLGLKRGLSGAQLDADEGGIGVKFDSNGDALRFVVSAIEAAGLRPGEQLSLAIDVAANEFAVEGGYRFESENRDLDTAALLDEIEGWTREFPLLSVEDPLQEDSWPGWQEATARIGGGVQIVGDDHFVTNVTRLERGIAEKSANAILVKVNQNGLVSRSHAVLERAKAAGFNTVVSARSGETEQSWLVDLAVGWGADQIKVGSTHRSERTAKWNRLLQLEATESTKLARFALPPVSKEN
ncbi:MAG: phosphopyruvate hydratase, partial [Pseudolysinimonas sp.]